MACIFCLKWSSSILRWLQLMHLSHFSLKLTCSSVIFIGRKLCFAKLWEKGLKHFYTDPDNDTGKWLKMFFGLPLLPANEIEDAFAEDIMSDALRDPEVENFTDYVFDTYIKPDARYPPNMWARMPDDTQIPTTTNGAENFHCHFKKCFKTPHPNIYSLAKELLGLQEETYVKLCSGNRKNTHRSATVQRRRKIAELCSSFRTGDLICADYLHEISFKFLPWKLNFCEKFLTDRTWIQTHVTRLGSSSFTSTHLKTD